MLTSERTASIEIVLNPIDSKKTVMDPHLQYRRSSSLSSTRIDMLIHIDH